MKGFDNFGVQELTRLEQREILGGEGFFELAGYFMGRAFGWLLEELEGSIRDWWEYSETRIPMPFQP